MSTVTAEVVAPGVSARSGDILGWWRNGVSCQENVRSRS